MALMYFFGKCYLNSPNNKKNTFSVFLVSLDFLAKRVADSNYPVFVSLVPEEMALHEHLEFDGQQFVGCTGKNT